MHPAAIQLTKAIHEGYLKKKGYRLVSNSRRVYEKARANYKDMPSADPASEDWGGQLLRIAR